MADRAQGILLDTSAVIAHLRGRIDVLTLTSPAEPLFLSQVALAELYKGAKKSARCAHNRQRVDDFLQIATCFVPTALPQRSTPQPPWNWKSKAKPSPRTTSGRLSRSNAICRWRSVMPTSSVWRASLSLCGSR